MIQSFTPDIAGFNSLHVHLIECFSQTKGTMWLTMASFLVFFTPCRSFSALSPKQRQVMKMFKLYDKLLRMQLDAPTKELRPSVNKLLAQCKIIINNGQYVLPWLPLIVIHTTVVFFTITTWLLGVIDIWDECPNTKMMFLPIVVVVKLTKQ